MEGVTISDTRDSLPLPSFFSPWRLKWYPRAFLFALAVAFLIAMFTGQGASTLTGRLGGDYPAFYGAGRIIADGDGGDLYNSTKQAAAQKGLYPGEDNVFMPFPYPPFFAAVYYPLALLPYRLSFAIHTLLMVALLFITIHLMAPIHKHINHAYLFITCLTLSFYPMLRAVLGGQNSALSLFLCVLSWRLIVANKHLSGGIILGLMLFKPQFGVPLICLSIISRRWHVGVGSLITALFIYGAGAIISGPLWIIDWYRYAMWLAQADAAINYDKAVSWLGFFQAIAGGESHIATLIGWGMSIATVLAVSLLWILGGRTADFTAQLGIGMVALVLMPPHVNYYDTSLILFTWLVLLGKLDRRSFGVLGIFWGVSFSQPLSILLGFSPLFLLAAAMLVLSIMVLGKPAMGVQCPH